MWIAGADGCPAGWVVVRRHRRSGDLRLDVHPHVRDLLRGADAPRVLAIDIPVGLTDAGPRRCDEEARRAVGPRRSSVFPAPVRPALRAASREEASRITRAADGRGVGAQAWNIYPKIRELDELLGARTELGDFVREVHPEVCFWAMNGGEPLAAAKRTPPGAAMRRRLLDGWLGRGAAARLVRRARSELGATRRDLADDDVLDAAAALWTADRIDAGTARTLPASPPVDSTGLRMEIVY